MIPHASEHPFGQALALRDFFSAKGLSELTAAVQALLGTHSLTNDELKAVEYEFNRLFVGPDAVPAPPFASVYLEEEPQLMGRSTLEVRELLCGLGLAVPEGGEPDDFLPYELEAWIQLCMLEEQVSSEQDLKTILDARRWLVLEHMACWLPAFIVRAVDSSDSPVISTIVKLLENWLHAAKENV